jgi:hypothetical protein
MSWVSPGEAAEPLLDIERAGIERGDDLVERRPTLAQLLFGAAVALVDQRDRLDQAAAVGVELRGELAEIAQHLVGY